MNLGNNSGISHASAWDILLFVIAAGLVGGFLFTGYAEPAEKLCTALFGALFGYARGRK